MLFNSPFFIFVFLPIVIFTFYLLGSRGFHRLAIVWLVSASLFFYGWWNVNYLLLISLSLMFNYSLGSRIVVNRSRLLMILGVTANLCLLGYYKYANFFIDSLNPIIGTDYNLEKIILPLAISFFTFEQISYLVDSYRGNARNYSFIHYCIFVLFFPQLIAGPIVHHHEMIPQFENKRIFKFRLHRFVIGVTIFFIGLFKKVVIADSVALYVAPVFDIALSGTESLSFFAAWGGAIAYSFQLYFDFSGYADMAIGIAMMFGIRMPLNFHSPYKAVNIIDFWRRWHMTLSRFLREYLYIPLGGNKKGKARRYINLIIVMLLGGLWHGAGWTFVVWGGLHGFYLIINHAWQSIKGRTNSNVNAGSWLSTWLSRIITFIAITVAWVFFRAENMDAAFEVLKGMAGVNGVILPGSFLHIFNQVGDFGGYLEAHGVQFGLDVAFNQWGFPLLFVLLIFTWFSPNTQQLMARYKPTFTVFQGATHRSSIWQWRLTPYSAIYSAVLTLLAIIGLNEVSEFLYFQF